MHICFITDHYPKPGEAVGGIGVFVQTLGRALVKNGIRVTAIGAGYKIGSTDDDEGVTVIRIPKSKWPFLKFVQQVWTMNNTIKKIHRQYPVDILECSEVGLALFKKREGIRFLIRLHGGHHFFKNAEHLPLVPKTVWQEKQSFKKADALVACSHFVNRETAKYIYYNPGQTTIIYNSVNFAEMSAIKANRIRNSIFFCGAICEKKGARQLVMAFAKVKAAVPDAKLIMAGKPVISKEGISYMETLKKHISPALAPSIVFTGVVPHHQIYSQMAEAHICVYPSHMEALPIAWLESMALGKPVVASATGPGPEVITHGKDGLLCNPFDPDDIAEKIIEMLTNNELSERCGRAAQQTVQEKFNIEGIVKHNIRFYNHLMETDYSRLKEYSTLQQTVF